MIRAALIASRSECHFKHGAILVLHQSVIAWGWNRFRNNPYSIHDRPFDLSYHAEVATLSRVKNKEILRRCTLYIARVNSNGITRPSKPCYNCSNTISSLDVKRVVHT